MMIMNTTRVQIQQEGIEHLSDLFDFDEETQRQIIENLRRPAGKEGLPILMRLLLQEIFS